MGIARKHSGGGSFMMTLMLLAIIVSWGTVTALVFIFSAQTPDPDMLKHTGLLENIVLVAAAIAVILGLLGIFGSHFFSGMLGVAITVILAALVFLALNGYVRPYNVFIDDAAQRYETFHQMGSIVETLEMPIRDSR